MNDKYEFYYIPLTDELFNTKDEALLFAYFEETDLAPDEAPWIEEVCDCGNTIHLVNDKTGEKTCLGCF